MAKKFIRIDLEDAMTLSLALGLLEELRTKAGNDYGVAECLRLKASILIQTA